MCLSPWYQEPFSNRIYTGISSLPNSSAHGCTQYPFQGNCADSSSHNQLVLGFRHKRTSCTIRPKKLYRSLRDKLTYLLLGESITYHDNIEKCHDFYILLKTELKEKNKTMKNLHTFLLKATLTIFLSPLLIFEHLPFSDVFPLGLKSPLLLFSKPRALKTAWEKSLLWTVSLSFVCLHLW